MGVLGQTHHMTRTTTVRLSHLGIDPKVCKIQKAIRPIALPVDRTTSETVLKRCPGVRLTSA